MTASWGVCQTGQRPAAHTKGQGSTCGRTLIVVGYLGTIAGRFDKQMFNTLSDALASSQSAGVRFPELITEIEGPALQIIPSAIFA